MEVAIDFGFGLRVRRRGETYSETLFHRLYTAIGWFNVVQFFIFLSINYFDISFSKFHRATPVLKLSY